MADDDDNGEACQRCGEVDHDRRTLWMACFYAMHELGLPFGQAAVHGRYRPLLRTEKTAPPFPMTLPVWGEPQGEERDHAFYTLRVCKRCRGEWMAAIAEWFRSVEPERESPGTGIFIRRNGDTVEVTEQEYREYAASKVKG